MNSDCFLRESDSRWHISIDRWSEKFQLRIAKRLKWLWANMNHGRVFYFELVLEWNRNLLLWLDHSWDLHRSDAFKILCVHERDKQILMVRCWH